MNSMTAICCAWAQLQSSGFRSHLLARLTPWATIALRPRGAVALLRLVNDSLWAASQFSRDGRSVIWADSDGGVSLCELREVRERLAGAGLGR